MPVPSVLFSVQSDGSTTVNVIVQEQPAQVAVIVTDPALSLAVNLVLPPEAGLTVPSPLVTAQLVAGPGVTVSLTSSPTPILVRARFAGEVATVWEVTVQVFASLAGSTVQGWVAELHGIAGSRPEFGSLGFLLAFMRRQPD
jgi:hypothetical protein